MTQLSQKRKFARVAFTFFVLLLTPIAFAQEDRPIHLADPTVFLYEETYYLYGTVEGNADEGFLVYTSSDRKGWEGPVGATEGFALKKEDVFGDRGFWAPQVFHHQEKFYMAYTANENIAIAVSESPLGPFIQSKKQPLEAPVKMIDPFVYQEEDGKVYLYHVRLKEGNRIFVAELKEDFSAIKEETLTECVDASAAWENTTKASWPVAEGPSILRKGSWYYLVYSANDFRNPDYAVGYALSRDPLGPWIKSEDNPILNRTMLKLPGTGHGDFFNDKSGDLWYVFHTHFAEDTASPRRTALIRIAFSELGTEAPKLAVDPESSYFLELQ